MERRLEMGMVSDCVPGYWMGRQDVVQVMSTACPSVVARDKCGGGICVLLKTTVQILYSTTQLCIHSS